MSSTPSAAVPAAGVRVELWRGDELVGAGETDVDGRIRELADGRAGHATASSSTRRRPSSAASSSRSISARATITSRCCSRRTRARATAAAERRRAGRALRGPNALRRAARGARRPARAGARESRATLSRRGEEGGARRASCDRRARSLSARSAAEQGTDEAPELEELNRAYEDQFGFRFVVFVNRRPKRELVPILRAAARAHARGGARRRRSTSSSSIAEDRWRRR